MGGTYLVFTLVFTVFYGAGNLKGILIDRLKIKFVG